MSKALQATRAGARCAPHHPRPTYAIGELYVAALPELKEVEIEDVVADAQMVKLKGEGWLDSRTFQRAVKARLGRVVYGNGLLGLKRKIIREA